MRDEGTETLIFCQRTVAVRTLTIRAHAGPVVVAIAVALGHGRAVSHRGRPGTVIHGCVGRPANTGGCRLCLPED